MHNFAKSMRRRDGARGLLHDLDGSDDGDDGYNSDEVRRRSSLFPPSRSQARLGDRTRSARTTTTTSRPSGAPSPSSQ
jgi:hypothetical protein